MTNEVQIGALEEMLSTERQLYRHYLNHARVMLDTEDLHGLWDAAVNASEVHNRIDSLERALRLAQGKI